MQLLRGYTSFSFGYINNMKKINYYLNIFFMCSFLGFLMEGFLKLFNKNMNSGILYGPWVPIYGLGAVLVIIIFRTIFNRTKFKKISKAILVFLTVVVIMSVLEFLGGILIEGVFHKTFWDYSNMKFNLGKYICLEMSLLWGVLSFVFLYLIKPLEEKIMKKIPNFITYLVSIIFILDVILTFFKS